MKSFRINPPIGTAHHSISYHDGVQTHRDGSPFWGIEIFKTRRAKDKQARKLRRQGYVES